MSPRVTFYDIPFADRLALIGKLANAAWDRKRGMLIATTDLAMAEEVDDFLWSFDEDSFIPHEIRQGDGTEHDAEALIVISPVSAGRVALPSHDVLVQLDAVDIDFAATFNAVVDVVAREDAAATERSRERFRLWRQRGVKPEFRQRI